MTHITECTLTHNMINLPQVFLLIWVILNIFNTRQCVHVKFKSDKRKSANYVICIDCELFTE